MMPDDIELTDQMIFMCNLIGAIASALSLSYVKCKIKLNVFLKIIFCILALQNTLCFVVMMIGSFMIIVSGERPLSFCILYQIPMGFLTISSFLMNTTISILRYLITIKSTDNRIMDKWVGFSIVIMACLLSYLDLAFLILKSVTNPGVLITRCTRTGSSNADFFLR